MKNILILFAIILASCTKQSHPAVISASFYNSNGNIAIYLYSTEKVTFADTVHVSFELLSNGVHVNNFDHEVYFNMHGYEARYVTDIRLQYVPSAGVDHATFSKFAGVDVTTGDYKFNN